MSNNKLAMILGVVAVVVFAIGAIFLLSNNGDSATRVTDTRTESAQQSNQTETIEDSSNDTVDSATTFTTAQVAENNAKDSCWTIVDGKVYDITEYIPRHPGGDEILKACGTDGSSLFNDRKTDEGETVGSGEPHSRSAENQLEQLYIGDLSQ